jgi:hypothetical protein
MRSPKWNRDEIIICLNLYLNEGGRNLQKNDPKILEVSQILNQLPSFGDKSNYQKFRNVNGVYMKLGNFKTFDKTYSGSGLKGGSKLDKIVFDEFFTQKDKLKIIAEKIQLLSLQSDLISSITEDEYEDLIYKILNLKETEKITLVNRRTEQDILKKHLFGKKTISQCACCNKEFPITYLVSAHIKRRSNCTQTEKRDLNIVFPMCKFGCDELFENGYIVVKEGKFQSMNKTPTTKDIELFIEQIHGNTCSYFNSDTERYFNWHFEFHNIN